MKRKVWKTLKTAFKVLFITIVIFLLLSLLNDFLNAHNALIEKVNMQSEHIRLLQGEITNVNEQLDIANAKVEAMKVSINNQPVIMTETDLEREIKPQLKEVESPSLIPITIVGALQILKGIVSPNVLSGF